MFEALLAVVFFPVLLLWFYIKAKGWMKATQWMLGEKDEDEEDDED